MLQLFRDSLTLQRFSCDLNYSDGSPRTPHEHNQGITNFDAGRMGSFPPTGPTFNLQTPHPESDARTMKILAFAATSSKHSINKQLIGYATQILEDTAGADVTVETIDLNDYEMPIYSIDRQNEDGIPQAAHDFFDKIGQADAVLISFAEHNGFYTAAYKNLFDWTSRIDMARLPGQADRDAVDIGRPRRRSERTANGCRLRPVLRQRRRRRAWRSRASTTTSIRTPVRSPMSRSTPRCGQRSPRSP